MSNKQQKNISFQNSGNKNKNKKEQNEQELIIKWINEIKNENTRAKAIKNLSQLYEKNCNIALYLWYSRGTIAALLQEIVSSYQYLSSLKLTLEKSNKICCTISLFQYLACNNEIRHEFLESKIPIFLYPFISNNNKGKSYEYLKLTSLSVINALLKINDKEVISFLIETAIIPILLKIMEKGSELARKNCCYIVYQIVQDDEGIKYICNAKERYSAIIQYMKKMLKNKFSQGTIHLILKVFLRLSRNKEARNMLKIDVSKEINDENFISCLDDSSKKLLNNLLIILNEKDDDVGVKELKKDLFNVNNNIQNLNIVNNINLNNNITPQLNSNNGNIIIQNNININMMMANQMNQMKIQPGLMIPPNFVEMNYNIYNINDNYINNANFLNNQNPNNGFRNLNYYNLYNNI